MIGPPYKTVCLLDGLKYGGVQTGALLQLPLLDTSRFQPEVWTLRTSGPNMELAASFRAKNIPVAEVPVRHYRDRKGILALAARLSRERVVLLDANSFYPNIVGRLAAALAGVPVIVANYHHTYEHKWNAKFILYEKMLRKHTEAFVCVSRSVRDTVQPLLNLPKHKTYVLYNGIDLAAYQSGASKTETRRVLGLPEQVPIVTVVGRLTRVKNVSSLIAAVPHIQKHVPGVLVLVIGDGEEREPLQQQVEREGLQSAVRFLGSREEIPQFLRAVDCLVLPSLAEGFGRVVVEGFAGGTPVVATNVGGVREIVRDGENGLLVPVSNPAKLAEAVCRTLTRPDETRKRVDQAYRDVQAFGLQNWVEKKQEIFQTSIESRREAIARFLGPAARPGTSFSLWRYAEFRIMFELNRLVEAMKGSGKSG